MNSPMMKKDTLSEVRALGKDRVEIVAVLRASPLAPQGKALNPTALGMWFSRERVPFMWRAAVLERCGQIELTPEAAA